MGEWEDDWHFFLDLDPFGPESLQEEPETVNFVEMTGETEKAIEAAPIDGDGYPAWFPKSRIKTNLKKVGDQGHITMPSWLWDAKVEEGFDWIERLWWNGKRL